MLFTRPFQASYTPTCKLGQENDTKPSILSPLFLTVFLWFLYYMQVGVMKLPRNPFHFPSSFLITTLSFVSTSSYYRRIPRMKNVHSYKLYIKIKNHQIMNRVRRLARVLLGVRIEPQKT